MAEKQFQSKVMDLARCYGWRCYHTYDSRRSEPGFPDLVLIRDTVLFRELKTNTGRVSKAQAAWGVALEKGGADFKIWRPRDWKSIIQELSR